uniref:Signal recognition particle 9 kDa protein n=1 Tax=Taeniopygia guttata TaxID=59729 RepID=H0Z107_TAEGU
METEQALKESRGEDGGGKGGTGRDAENRLQMNEPAGSGSSRREGGGHPPPSLPPPAAATSVFTSQTSERDTSPAAERGIPPSLLPPGASLLITEGKAQLLLQCNTRRVRVVLKYRHCDGNLCIKVTDDVACLLYRTDQAQDVKKIEKFHSQLMRLMVAKESRSAAMETD